MKRLLMKIILTTILIGIQILSYSQKAQIEILFRPTLTSQRGNPFVETYFNPTVHFTLGVGINYFIKENSILNFGLLYDKKGASGSSTVQIRDSQNQIIGEDRIELESNYNYITLPIEWGKRFGKKVKYQFGTGLYTSYLLSAEQIQKDQGLITRNTGTTNFNKLDFGLSASFSAYIPINEKMSFKLGLIDNFGLTNISSVPVANKGTIKNNSLGLNIGLNYILH